MRRGDEKGMRGTRESGLPEPALRPGHCCDLEIASAAPCAGVRSSGDGGRRPLAGTGKRPQRRQRGGASATARRTGARSSPIAPSALRKLNAGKMYHSCNSGPPSGGTMAWRAVRAVAGPPFPGPPPRGAAAGRRGAAGNAFRRWTRSPPPRSPHSRRDC